MATENVAMKPSLAEQPVNPWGSSLDKLKEWDPKGANLLLRVGTNPWTSGVLPRKEVELIYLALNCSCTNLDEAGTRRQIRASLDAGATRDEILLVLKCGVGLAVHSCSLGAPILLEEMKAAGSKTGGGPQTGGPGLRRHARDWSVEYGLGSVLRSLPGLDRSVLRLGSQRLQERHLHTEIHGTDQYRLRRVHHPHVCARHPAAHPGSPQGRSNAGRDHDGPAAVRIDGC
jgi:alkylhydroperoxidase/carboxymuconolactone decarboxylase family protein YurZ